MSSHWWLACVIVLAVVLRIIFFVGLVSGDPQDDGVYYGNAFRLYQEGPRYLDAYRHLPADVLANPIDQFNVRPMVTYPIAATFALFGPGEVSATLWALFCSILLVLVVFRLGAIVHGKSVGLTSALLCAFYPLEVINGSRILSDVQVGFFSALGLLLLIEGEQRKRLSLLMLSGAALGGAYLANARGLIWLASISGFAVVRCLRGQSTWRVPAFMIVGFLGVFCVEACVYYVRTGNPLLSYDIQSGAVRYKYVHELVSTIRWGPALIEFTNGEPLELTRSVLHLHDRPTNQFGIFFFLFAVAALFSVIRRRNLLLVAIAVGLFAYLEWGPVRISLDWPRRQFEYMMVFKQERFLLMLTAPLLIVSADMLVQVARRQRIAFIVVLAVLFGSSLSAIAQTRDYYRAGLQELRDVASVVRSEPQRLFFSDQWAVLHLNIFTRHRARNLRILDARTDPEEVRQACVLLGGSRGVELLADYVESTLPAFALRALEPGSAPRDWTLVKAYGGKLGPHRLRHLSLYCTT